MAGLGDVFEESVAQMLDLIDDGVDAGYFGNRTFHYSPATARMVSDGLDDVDATSGKASFATHIGTSIFDRRLAFMESALGMLLHRQDLFGPLFNYPRTFVVGPRASFSCRTSTVGGSGWGDNPLLKNKEHTVPFKDVDQVIWVNLCASEFKLPTSPQSMVEIGIVRFRHETREGDFAAPESVGSVRFYNGQKSVPYPRLKTIDEFAALHPLIFEKYDVAQSEWPHIENVGDVFVEGDLAHVKAAAVVLERLMGDRTSSIRDLMQYNPKKKVTIAQTRLVYKAIIGGQMPPTANDLNEDERQPTVMPGEYSIERIANVMEHVMRGTPKDEPKKKKASRRGGRRPRTRAQLQNNPYAQAFGGSEGKQEATG